MRYLKATLATLSLLANALISPVFIQWYKQQTGLTEPESLLGLNFTLVILGILQIFLLVSSWVSAIKDKSLKQIFETETES